MHICSPYESLSANRKGWEEYVFEDEDDDDDENDLAYCLNRLFRSLAAGG
jgi:hypothetical protein